MTDRDFWSAVYLELIKSGRDTNFAIRSANEAVEARSDKGSI